MFGWTEGVLGVLLCPKSMAMYPSPLHAVDWVDAWVGRHYFWVLVTSMWADGWMTLLLDGWMAFLGTLCPGTLHALKCITCIDWVDAWVDMRKHGQMVGRL